MAPNTVVARIWASTFAGMYLILSLSISSFSATGSLPPWIDDDPPDLDAAQLDLGVGLHHQARPIGGQRDRLGRLKVPTNNAYVSQSSDGNGDHEE